MSLHTSALSLFASAVAVWLGLVVLGQMLFGGGAFGLAIGASVIAFVGMACFLGVAKRMLAVQKTGMKIIAAAALSGALCVWFWMVPAQSAVLTVACKTGNITACERTFEEGGFPADIALTNDDFVTYKCQSHHAEFCRVAASRRLIHPARFCPDVRMEEGFEVVEWCTPNKDGDVLVARR